MHLGWRCPEQHRGGWKPSQNMVLHINYTLTASFLKSKMIGLGWSFWSRVLLTNMWLDQVCVGSVTSGWMQNLSPNVKYSRCHQNLSPRCKIFAMPPKSPKWKILAMPPGGTKVPRPTILAWDNSLLSKTFISTILRQVCKWSSGSAQLDQTRLD